MNIPKPSNCSCSQPGWRSFSCPIHWHDKTLCDETHTQPLVGEAVSDNRLRTLLHGFGYSPDRPKMFSNITGKEG